MKHKNKGHWPSDAPVKIRLTAPIHYQGHIYEVGEVIELPAGVRGPHRTRTLAHAKDNREDGNMILPEVLDEPLYEPVDESA
jgi:hypothetical protein